MLFLGFSIFAPILLMLGAFAVKLNFFVWLDQYVHIPVLK